MSAPLRRRRTASKPPSVQLPFEPINYGLLILGVVLIGAGFLAMRLENAVDGWISLYLAPLVILAGFVQIGVAILYRAEP